MNISKMREYAFMLIYEQEIQKEQEIKAAEIEKRKTKKRQEKAQKEEEKRRKEEEKNKNQILKM